MKKIIMLLACFPFLFYCTNKLKPAIKTDYETIKKFVYDKNTEKLKEIFSEKISLTNDQEKELITYAMNNHYENLVLLMIENGLDVDFKIQNKTLFYCAVNNNQYNLAIKLIDLGANPFMKYNSSSDMFIAAMKTENVLLQKKIIDKMNLNIAEFSMIDFSIGVSYLSDEVFDYFLDSVFNEYSNVDSVAFALRELISREKIDLVLELVKNDKIFDCLVQSKVTPYIVSENFSKSHELYDLIEKLKKIPLKIDSSEPYIQNAIETKNYDSIDWLVKNGANFKDELPYFSNTDNVINFINYKLSFNEDREEFEILIKYIKYFENLL